MEQEFKDYINAYGDNVISYDPETGIATDYSNDLNTSIRLEFDKEHSPSHVSINSISSFTVNTNSLFLVIGLTIAPSKLSKPNTVSKTVNEGK